MAGEAEGFANLSYAINPDSGLCCFGPLTPKRLSSLRLRLTLPPAPHLGRRVAGFQ